ncbi:keratin-associated protein 13-1-like [Marmota marmota marmota]|uniref:keratin-associated protein 13-1-like n=1 Tax=Marmota marmota marmota TaxID=9994 RepID=UPI0007625B00|nr:keratin-associated protein 13-1-like [Marmota marmota marmota]
MSHSCHSGYFSHSFGGHLPYSRSFCGSSYPRNLVYTTNFHHPRTCHLGSSHYRGCQEIFHRPSRCQNSCVVSRTCYHPRTFTHCSPCQSTYAGSLGFGSSSCHSLGFGSRSCHSLGYGSRSCHSLGHVSGSCHSLGYGSRSSCSLGYRSKSCYPSGYGSIHFRPLGYRIHDCPSLGYGSGFHHPTYVASRSFQSSCYRPTFGSAF